MPNISTIKSLPIPHCNLNQSTGTNLIESLKKDMPGWSLFSSAVEFPKNSTILKDQSGKNIGYFSQDARNGRWYLFSLKHNKLAVIECGSRFESYPDRPRLYQIKNLNGQDIGTVKVEAPWIPDNSRWGGGRASRIEFYLIRCGNQRIVGNLQISS